MSNRKTNRVVAKKAAKKAAININSKPEVLAGNDDQLTREQIAYNKGKCDGANDAIRSRPMIQLSADIKREQAELEDLRFQADMQSISAKEASLRYQVALNSIDRKELILRRELSKAGGHVSTSNICAGHAY